MSRLSEVDLLFSKLNCLALDLRLRHSDSTSAAKEAAVSHMGLFNILPGTRNQRPALDTDITMIA